MALQLFWCKILINDVQIRKGHANTRCVVIFSSQQFIATTKKFFDEKKKNFIEKMFDGSSGLLA